MTTRPILTEDRFYQLLRTTGIPSASGYCFTADMRDNLEAYVLGHAEHTITCFRHDIGRWFRFADAEGVDPMRPQARDVRDFIRRVGEGLHPDSSRRMLSSISIFLSRIVCGENVTTAEIVRAEIKQFARIWGRGHGQSAPIRRRGSVVDLADEALPFSIDRMTQALEPCTHPREVRSRLILSMGGDTGRRGAEYRAAKMGHITEEEDGTGLLLIPRSKTDQDGEGIVVMLSRRTMRYYHQWRATLAYHGEEIGPSTPLLRSIDGHGRLGGPLWQRGFTLATRSAVRESLRIIDNGAGVIEFEKIANSVGGHSFRIGMAQDLTAAGESLPSICNAGGWFDSRMPIRYARHLAPRSGAMWRLNRRLGEE